MNTLISPSDTLKQLIAQKEEELREEGVQLKEHFLLAYESLLPFNVLKSSIQEAVTSTELHTNLSKMSVGITLGYFANRLFTGQSQNPVKKFVGNIIGNFVNNTFVHNADTLGIVTRIAFRHLTKWSILS